MALSTKLTFRSSIEVASSASSVVRTEETGAYIGGFTISSHSHYFPLRSDVVSRALTNSRKSELLIVDL